MKVSDYIHPVLHPSIIHLDAPSRVPATSPLADHGAIDYRKQTLVLFHLSQCSRSLPVPVCATQTPIYSSS